MCLKIHPPWPMPEETKRIGRRCCAKDERTGWCNIDAPGQIGMTEVNPSVDHAHLHSRSSCMIVCSIRMDNAHIPLAGEKSLLSWAIITRLNIVALPRWRSRLS